MKYADQILREIEGRRNQGAGLDRFASYLHTIDDPQDAYPSIHIAGTNGKGSTLNDIRSILQYAGYRVGTFSSPYLEVHYDRIRINDHFIEEQDFIRYYDRYHREWQKWGFSSFEIDTLICFLYFKDQKVDIALIEAGIGGRYDCTNVIRPLISVITNIGMDHMDRLGNSYADIAWQKGGIIKDGIPLVTAEKKPEVLAVLKQICEEKRADLIQTAEGEQIVFDLCGIQYQYKDLQVALAQPALYQIDNSACAIEAAKLCKERYHYPITNTQIQKGLATAIWKGRFEIMSEDPMIIIDGAHNEDGIRALCESIQAMGNVRILFAALKDKDSDAMMKLLCDTCEDIWISEFDDPRCQRAEVLAGDFPVHIEKDYRHVINMAKQDPNSSLIITGSLYFISRVRQYLIEQSQ